MNQSNSNRRNFLKNTSMLSGAYLLSGLQNKVTSQTIAPANTKPIIANRIKFAVINIDHPHIYGMTDAIKRGGGELVALYAKQPDLAATFIKTYPEAKLVKSENEILEDPAIQLVLSSGIPDERAPLGIRVMQHGKDYFATSDDYPQIRVPLEMIGEGLPKLLAWEVQKPPYAGYGILRFSGGSVRGKSGPEDFAALLDNLTAWAENIRPALMACRS